MKRFWVPALACLLSLTTGCLGTTYRIPHDELVRLAQQPGETRGDSVRVVQNFSMDDPEQPPRFPEAPPANLPPVAIGVNIGPTYGAYAPYGSAPPPPTFTGVHEGPVAPGVGVAPSAPGVGVAPTAPPVSAGSGANTQSHSGGGASASGGGGSSGGGDDSFIVIAIVVVAAAAAVALIWDVMEASRFDGTAAMGPGYPVELHPNDGEPIVVPLAGITPELAAATNYGLVAEGIDPSFRRIARGPVDRQGFALSLDMGASDYAQKGLPHDFGFRAQIGFGYFPIKQFGVLLTAGAGIRDGARVDVRYGAEVRALPLHLWRFNLGAYADLGGTTMTAGLAQEPHLFGGYLGAGALLEVDLVTRLGLLIRAGVNAAEWGGALLPRAELTLGLVSY